MKLFIKQQLKWHIKGVFALMALLSACSFAFGQQPQTVKDLYEKKCSGCHGKAGTKTLFGAKNLQKSIIDDIAIAQIILNGKKLMPAYKKKISDTEIKQITAYIKTLRN